VADAPGRPSDDVSAVLERRGTTAGPRGPVPVTARTRAVPAPPRLSRQLIRFAAIGAASTGAYLVLYLLLRPLGAQQANAIALLVTAIANTAANRRLTFAVRGPERLIRNQLQGLVDRLRSQPATPERTEALIRSLVWLGDGNAAVEAARAAVASGGGPPALSLLMGSLLVAGRLEEAEALQRQRIALVPTRVPSRWSLALVLAGQGRQAEALHVLDEAEQIGEGTEPDQHRYVRAMVLGGSGRPDAVWREASRVAAADPGQASHLAVLLAVLGDAAHAEALRPGATSDSPADRQLAALLAWRRGDAVEALAQLRALEDRDPWPWEGMFPSYLAAEVAAAAGDHREVLAASKRFGRLWVRGYWYGWASSRLLLLTARAHRALGERDEARAAVETLLARLGRADRDLPLLREALALRARR